MTKTRNISDLLDANGDVKSGALDNVPASNDASALTTGTLPSARLGTVTSFTSTGIDDNATGTSLTIASDGRNTVDSTNERALVVHHSDGSNVSIGMNNNSTNSNEIAFDSTDFVVKPGGFEKLRINSSGHIGAGTSSPGTYNLNIQDSSSSTTVLLRGASGQGAFSEFDVDGWHNDWLHRRCSKFSKWWFSN